MPSSTISRRRFLQWGAGAALTAALPLVGGAYTSRVEPYSLSITRLAMSIPNLAPAFAGLTLLQISDLHFGEWMTLPRMMSIIEQINALKPDIIAVTGDFVSDPVSLSVYADVTAAIAALKAPHGIVATLGNHDHWTGAARVKRAVSEAGNVRWLLNDNVALNVALQRGSESLYLAGVDDVWEGQNDLDQALARIPPRAPVILLAHEGDYADQSAQTKQIVLQLSGHSHGGQIRLPGKGALILPELGEKYDMGLYQIGEMKLYVNRGLGMVAPFVRFNCPPEVTVFTLVPT